MRKSKSSWAVFFLAVLITAGSLPAAKKAKPAEVKDPLAGISLNAFKLRGIGPALTSGRISDIAINPGDKSEFFVAAASGGVWKTTNTGTTFTPVFDRQGSFSIGCLAYDPNNYSVVWVGTGENNNQRCVGYGDGIYKSVDSGRSWKNMGLKDSQHIGMIKIDPRNSDVVYAAAYGPLWNAGGDRGLYKSVDGGQTWEAVLTVSEHTGVSEVHLDPCNPDVMYATAHQRRRHVFTLIDGGPESGIYKSTDAGATWKKINRGLPSDDMGRIAMAISPVDPEIMYAIVEGKRGQGGFYRSTNRGASWEKRNSYFSSGNYYQELVCDPGDADRVYSMDTYLQVSDDGGLTWRSLGERSKHIDNHCMWIDPDDTRHYLVGDDGGLYESFDRGNTWKFFTNLPVTQFYKVAVDNTEPFYFVYGGTQDNYSLGGPSRTTSRHGIVSADWYTTQGGDGFESAIDPADPNIVYAQSQYGNLSRFDKKSGENLGIKPKERKGEKGYRWNWDAPLFVSPHLHTRIYFAANKVFRSDDRGSTWQVISDDLTRQIDRNTLEVMGRVWPMDAVAKNASTSPYGTIVALDESPLEEGLLYAGTDDGLIQVTEDGGVNWRKIDKFPGVPLRTYVNEVLASRHDRNTVYAAFNNHKNGDFKPYVLKSADAGQTWTSIASNLPERGSVFALEEDHVEKDLLFAGTEFGLFVSVDGGGHWKALKSGLPTVAVRDLAVQRRENDLVLATFGRGFYILDNYAPLREISSANLDKEAYVFPVKDAYMFNEKAPLGTLGSRDKGFQGEMYFTAPNPPFGATFTYYLKEGFKTLRQVREEKTRAAVKEGKPAAYPSVEEYMDESEEEAPFLAFTIFDEDGYIVRKLRAPARAGLHRITWDLRYPGLNPGRGRGGRAASASPSSTLVLPGKYSVMMSKNVDGVETALTEKVPFAADVLGGLSLPAEDWDALVSFQKDVRELNRAAGGISRILGELQDKTAAFREALKSVTEGDIELTKKIRGLEKKLAGLSTKLSGDRTARTLDLDVEPGLIRRLGSIISDHRGSLSAPTQSQRDAYALVAEEFPPILEAIKTIVETDVKEIERKLEELKAPYTPGRIPVWKR